MTTNSSRCIIVLGLPRSGTSAVAGTLRRLGVNMGKDHLQVSDHLNKRGYYEDRRWQGIHKAVAGRRYTTRFAHVLSGQHREAYRRLIKSCSRQRLWGFKSPRACFTLHHITPLLAEAGVDTRLVIVYRDFDTVVHSIQRHSRLAYGGQFRLSDDEARELMLNWQNALNTQIGDFDGQWCEVGFEALLEYPLTVTESLAEFCGIHGADILGAIGWLDKGLVTQ